jgi:hypothetical protein
MKINLETRRKIKALVEDGKDDGSGGSCEFYIVDNLGVKLFYEKFARDYSVKLQKKAHQAKLAPKVYGKINISDMYGYVTELANLEIRKNWGDEKADILFKKLRRVGILHEDLHDDNIGKIGNRIVCIDFCPESCEIIKKGSNVSEY